jgi:hypothetical protein
MYIMAMEAIKFNLFLSICIYLFSFFLCSHSEMTGVQLVSQRVMTEIKLLLCNTFSECLIDNLTSSFHILTQRFVLFFHGDRVPHKVCVCNCSENSTLLGQPLAQETIKIQSVACQSVCCKELLVRPTLQFVFCCLCAPPAFVTVSHWRRPISIPPMILNQCGFNVHCYDHPDGHEANGGMGILVKNFIYFVLVNLKFRLQVAGSI